MKNPKVSVIMSVYNGMPHLQGAVESILKQTHKNFEFIIVDDASTDGSWHYLTRLKDHRIKLIKNRNNLGLAKSLNIALAKITGDYVARMDADDVSLPKRFNAQVDFLVSHPEIAICGTWTDIIDEQGSRTGEKIFPVNNQEIKDSLPRFNPIVHPTIMARKKFFQDLGGYNPDYDGAEDYELLMRAFKKYKMANIGEKLLLWRYRQKRRSRQLMSQMDKLELKIKLESLRRNGISSMALIWIFKKALFTYLIPVNLKIALAKFFKLA